MYYANIDTNNIVIGISKLADVMSDPSMISIPDYDITLLGKTWDGTNFNDTALPAVTMLSNSAFLSRFTRAELTSFITNARSDASIQAIYDTWTLIRGSVDLEDAQTISDVNDLATAGVIAPARVSEILAPLIQ